MAVPRQPHLTPHTPPTARTRGAHALLQGADARLHLPQHAAAREGERAIAARARETGRALLALAHLPGGTASRMMCTYIRSVLMGHF